MGFLSSLGFGKNAIAGRAREQAFGNLQKRLQQNKTQRTSNTSVPKLSINHAGAAQTGNVTPNNATRNIRAEVFEQNFIRRIYTTFYNAISGREKVRLDSYEEKLNSAESEAESILYYDELVAIMNMLILYAMYFSVDQKVRNKLDTLVQDRNRELFEKVSSDLYKKGNFKNDKHAALAFAGGMVSVSGATIAITMALVTDAVGGMGFFTAGTILSVVIGGFVRGIRTEKFYREAEGNAVNKAMTMGTVIQEIHRILFANREYMFTQLVQEKKIKFWGMTQAQVDLMAKTGDSLTGETLPVYFQTFIKAYGKQPFAPNEPFSPEVMKVQLRLTNTNLSQLSNENRRTYEYESVYGPEAYANVNLPPATGKVNLNDEAYANLEGGRRTRRRNTRRRKSVRRR